MVSSFFSQDEKARLAVLRRFEGIDASPEAALDSITTLVAWFFNAPISVINLILHDRIIVKSFYGLEKAQVDLQAGWLADAIAAGDVFCITNALEHSLAKADPLVAGEFGLRFYAAAPLRTREGYSIGILSVIDRKPRDISVSEKEFLRRMAALVIDLIESQLTANRLFALVASLTDEAPRSASLTVDEQLLQMLADAGLTLAELKRRRAPSVGRNLSETSARRPHVGFNNSLIGESKQQQLAWLADKVTGDSPAIQETRELLRLAIIKQADSVLFIGETGTGKGVCALAIHEGVGARGRFIEVNCAALPRELIESELFGHEKGSFTGATGRKIGLFEQADGGTIFLDEIAELPPDLQVKLLTVLQKRELRRIGGSQSISVDVKVIAATNRPLVIALSDGTFRPDLFFRISSLRIELPALRDRGNDVILLARHFIAERVKSKRDRIEGLAPEAEDLLKQYDWPGNVRQLFNIIKRGIILESGNIISPQLIYRILEEEKRLFNLNCPADPGPQQSLHYHLGRNLVTESEARTIIELLTRNRNNKTKTAKELGITRGQLDYRLKMIRQMIK